MIWRDCITEAAFHIQKENSNELEGLTTLAEELKIQR